MLSSCCCDGDVVVIFVMSGDDDDVVVVVEAVDSGVSNEVDSNGDDPRLTTPGMLVVMIFLADSMSMSDCITSRFLQLSAMLSRFFQIVATVLLANPNSRATSLLLFPLSISWMIFIFCLIVNASRFRPCIRARQPPGGYCQSTVG